MRIGVAGLGGMGTLHAQNAASLPGLELTAVAATRPERAADVARELGVRACTYAELIAADDVEAVVVAARSIDHAEVGRAVLAAGKHLLLEKPGATDLASHAGLVEEAGRHPGAVVHVAYHRRFDPAFVELRRLVAEGAIGEPLLAIGTSRDVRTPEPEDPAPAGGFLVDMACHDYDAACWLLGQEPVEVFAARQALVYPELEVLGDLDNALVTIRFDGGALATTHVSRTCAFGHDIRVEVVGSEGSAFLGNAASRDGVTVVAAAGASAFPVDYRERFAEAYRAELAAFAAACGGADVSLPGLDDDRRAVAVGVAARSSAVARVPRETGVDWPFEPGPTA